MKNIRKFETTAEMDAAVLEDVSVSYVNEENKVYTTHENNVIKDYLRFVAVEDSVIQFSLGNGGIHESLNVQYSYDSKNWSQYYGDGLELPQGKTLYLRGYNEHGVNEFWYSDQSKNIIHSFYLSHGIFECHGNIMSLMYGDSFEDENTYLGYNELNAGCLCGLFFCCTGLTTAPTFPKSELTSSCYYSMFLSCSNLKIGPVLPASYINNHSYEMMFSGCSNLTQVTVLATDMNGDSPTSNWLYGVSPTGTFIKHPDMDVNRFSNIPEGWTVEDAVL